MRHYFKIKIKNENLICKKIVGVIDGKIVNEVSAAIFIIYKYHVFKSMKLKHISKQFKAF